MYILHPLQCVCVFHVACFFSFNSQFQLLVLLVVLLLFLGRRSSVGHLPSLLHARKFGVFGSSFVSSLFAWSFVFLSVAYVHFSFVNIIYIRVYFCGCCGFFSFLHLYYFPSLCLINATTTKAYKNKIDKIYLSLSQFLRW